VTIAVDRRQVLAYRVAAHGLDRSTSHERDLAVLDLGVQDTPRGSARLALNARLAEPMAVDAAIAPELAMVWSHRGAPHLHRRTDLGALAKALWPLDDTDAGIRLGWSGAEIKKSGVGIVEALARTAGLMRTEVKTPTTKGAVSGAVTQGLPEPLSRWCPSCRVRHVHEQLFRLAALAAGLEIEQGAEPLTFVPLKRWPGVPKETAGPQRVVAAYLRLLGPATPADAAGFIGTRPAQARAMWPEDVAEVRIGARRTFITEDRVDALRTAAPIEGVRLLPPSDPFLQARDRELLVPDKAQRSKLWANLARMGAVLADGDISGMWRARLSSKRLGVAVTLFVDKLSKRAQAALEDEAERMATVRGASSAAVTFNEPGWDR